MEKINDIIESIANEKTLPVEDVKDRVKMAFVQTAKRLYGDEHDYEAIYDDTTKKILLFQKTLIVSNDDERLNEEGEKVISIKKAKEFSDNAEVGDSLSYALDLESFGRTASATLAKELSYHIQRLKEEKVYEKYTSKIGKLVTGNVIHIDSEETTYIDFDDIKAHMPRKNRIKNESFKVSDHVMAVVRRVYVDKINGIKMEVSRTTPKFLEALLEMEVPEIADGSVIIESTARIPGRRAKVALTSTSPNIDPIGATVGVKGVRINAVSKELGNENIDVIEYSAQSELMVSRAMAPAIINAVKIEDDKALVYIHPEQKSKAIGKEGINIRLASMLTGFTIELIEIGDQENKNNKNNHENENGLEGLKALFNE
ncbi:MAG: transcription termination/antitermination protein NusA [Campylobacter sp.]|nr:transcription termination/antitermination protein NusA [Campylobacter sp.]